MKEINLEQIAGKDSSINGYHVVFNVHYFGMNSKQIVKKKEYAMFVRKQ